MDVNQKLLTAIECLSTGDIGAFFKAGISPNALYKNKPLIYELLGGYARGPAFKSCIKVFADHGLHLHDEVLLAVLLDDASMLDKLLTANPQALQNRYSFDCAFTPLQQASLLHICAEYNHVACAGVLIRHGAGVNERAGIDENGFGGQTPIFHTMNQHANCCIDAMKLLLAHRADLTITLPGIVWGKGYDWETFIPSVNPVSYAMMGLLRQFQRTEQHVYEVVSILLKEKYGIDYFPGNIPNKYVAGATK